MINLILFGIVILFTISCRNDENCHDSILIKNNSSKAMYFGFSFRYPDTITLDPNPTLDKLYFKIENHSDKSVHYRHCIEDDFVFTSKIMCFIYNSETLETTPWDTVVKKYMILKRYDLTLHDLDSLNWIITYP